MMRRVKDIECEKCGQEFSTSEHTQCPVCKNKFKESTDDVDTSVDATRDRTGS